MYEGQKYLTRAGKTTISDLIQIVPQDFSKPSAQALEDNINSKYADKVIQKIGVCICMYDLLSASEGLIGHGTGIVNVNVTFRIVVFRPFRGEVIEGWIRGLRPEGVYGFFDDILIPAVNLFETSEFQESTTPSDSVWVWLSESGDIYYDIYERCRFRVEAEIWHDIAPQGPQLADKDGNGGSVGDANKNKVPYSIVGSMQQAGLGLTSWWQDQAVEEDG